MKDLKLPDCLERVNDDAVGTMLKSWLAMNAPESELEPCVQCGAPFPSDDDDLCPVCKQRLAAWEDGYAHGLSDGQGRSKR